MRTSHSREEKPELLIVDTKRVRQAAITRLLETWADVMGLTVNAVIPDALPESTNCEMIIVSLGSTSIEDAQCHILIDNVRKLMPRASLIIISDREDLQEVCAAFQEGASGFIPTSIEPVLAFQALSFIRSGGTFFPPSVLSTCIGQVAVDKPVCDSALTIKQEEVFALLRQGYSNKVIANRLNLSEATVKLHAHRIMQKFRVTNRTQLAVAAMNQSSLPAADISKKPSVVVTNHTT
jgi:DNA-binding NarL/FixJ family response regulator